MIYYNSETKDKLFTSVGYSHRSCSRISRGGDYYEKSNNKRSKRASGNLIP